MQVASLLDRLTTPVAEDLARIGFDVGRLRSMQARARSEEFRLVRMGLNVDRLRFYGWLVGNGRNPECGRVSPSNRRGDASEVCSGQR